MRKEKFIKAIKEGIAARENLDILTLKTHSKVLDAKFEQFYLEKSKQLTFNEKNINQFLERAYEKHPKLFKYIIGQRIRSLYDLFPDNEKSSKTVKPKATVENFYDDFDSISLPSTDSSD